MLIWYRDLSPSPVGILFALSPQSFFIFFIAFSMLLIICLYVSLSFFVAFQSCSNNSFVKCFYELSFNIFLYKNNNSSLLLSLLCHSFSLSSHCNSYLFWSLHLPEKLCNLPFGVNRLFFVLHNLSAFHLKKKVK